MRMKMFLSLNQGRVYIRVMCIDLCTKCYDRPEKEDVTLKRSKNSSYDSLHLFHSLKAHLEPGIVLGPWNMVRTPSPGLFLLCHTVSTKAQPDVRELQNS